VTAQVIVLAGPSGAGKSRLAERLRLPILRLDDFYKEGGDPTVPFITVGPNAGIIDWDDPESWVLEDAASAIEALCSDGKVDVPIYEISQDSRVGWQTLDLEGAPYFVAEGIFAQEVVPVLRDRGLAVVAAYCITQHPMITFWRRLTRDLREQRKPPLVALRRGWELMRAQPRVVAHAEALGCQVATPEAAYTEISGLAR
jgi:uridine kinase